ARQHVQGISVHRGRRHRRPVGFLIEGRGIGRGSRSFVVTARRIRYYGHSVASRASCLCSSVAQWQSIRLLTGGLLVRVQPEEPFFRSDRDIIGTIWTTNLTASLSRC